MSPSPPSRPRAVLFDWDDTLVDNWASIHDALNATLATMGQDPIDWTEMRRRTRLSLRNAFPRVFGAAWEEARDVFYGHFSRDHLKGLKPKPGAAEMLDYLAREGLYLGVVSNKMGPYLRREADHLGWSRYFGRLVGATDAAEDKPAVAPVDLALSAGTVKRGPEVWFVGDGSIDVECARNAGCVAVLIREELANHDDLSRFPPDWRVLTCAQLAGLVDRL